MSHFFDRKTDSFFGSLHYLGYILLLAGLIIAGSPWWSNAVEKAQMLSVGTLLFLLGLLFKYTYHGFQLDFQGRRVREYLSMFGIKTGKWVPFPTFQRIILTSNLAQADDHEHHHEGEPAPLVTWYTIGLYSQPKEADYELRTASQEDARQTLHLLATRLHVPAEDKTASSFS